jgi:hypothetical protein
MQASSLPTKLVVGTESFFSGGEKENLSNYGNSNIFITQKYNFQKIPLKQKPQILQYFITNLKSSFNTRQLNIIFQKSSL